MAGRAGTKRCLHRSLTEPNMTTQVIPQLTFPQTGTAFVDANGNITAPWRLFLNQIVSTVNQINSQVAINTANEGSGVAGLGAAVDEFVRKDGLILDAQTIHTGSNASGLACPVTHNADVWVDVVVNGKKCLAPFWTNP